MRLNPDDLVVTTFGTHSEIVDTLPSGHPTPGTWCGVCPPDAPTP